MIFWVFGKYTMNNTGSNSLNLGFYEWWIFTNWLRHAKSQKIFTALLAVTYTADRIESFPLRISAIIECFLAYAMLFVEYSTKPTNRCLPFSIRYLQIERNTTHSKMLMSRLNSNRVFNMGYPKRWYFCMTGIFSQWISVVIAYR